MSPTQTHSVCSDDGKSPTEAKAAAAARQAKTSGCVGKMQKEPLSLLTRRFHAFFFSFFLVEGDTLTRSELKTPRLVMQPETGCVCKIGKKKNTKSEEAKRPSAARDRQTGRKKKGSTFGGLAFETLRLSYGPRGRGDQESRRFGGSHPRHGGSVSSRVSTSPKVHFPPLANLLAPLRASERGARSEERGARSAAAHLRDSYTTPEDRPAGRRCVT